MRISTILLLLLLSQNLFAQQKDDTLVDKNVDNPITKGKLPVHESMLTNKKAWKNTPGDNTVGFAKTTESSRTDTIEDVVLINGKLYEATVSNGDTLPLINLPIVRVQREKVFKSKRDRRRYIRLERNVRKVYPFAKMANQRLFAYEHSMKEMDEKFHKKFMKKAEKDIRKEFGDELKALTFTQGRILLRLIDRETGNVSYDLVKELRGGFTAWLFQGVAKMFKYDLKSEYDPEKDDRLIEEIVRKIEQEDLSSRTVSR